MASLTSATLLLACLAFTGHVSSQALSDKVLNFMAVFAGAYNNSAQIQSGAKNLDLIEVLIIPTNMAALDGKIVLYMEESVNNKIYRMTIGEMTEGDDGVIYVSQYNFTDTSKYTPRSFKVEDLYNITKEDLKSTDNVKGAMKLVDPAVYFGTFQDAHHSLDGIHLNYAFEVTCGGYSVIPPHGSFEKRDLVPYDMRRQNESYPLVGAPDGYISPCE